MGDRRKRIEMYAFSDKNSLVWRALEDMADETILGENKYNGHSEIRRLFVGKWSVLLRWFAFTKMFQGNG